MGIVFGVYRNWIWEFGDLRSYTPILWGSIWPNTIISNPIYFFSLGSVVFGTQIRWTRGKSYLRDSTWSAGVCLWKYEVSIKHSCKPSTRWAPIKAEKAVLGTQHFKHLHNTSVDLMASDDRDDAFWGALAVALVVLLTYEKRRWARTLAE